MTQKTVTRFAPSPTGLLHVGNIRTALFNYLYTIKNSGKFILRIDDTDLERSTDEFAEQIISDLKWIGIKVDKIYKQSERIETYKKYFNQLVGDGFLYECFETQEELDFKRKRLISRRMPPVYDRASLNLSKDEIESIKAQLAMKNFKELLDLEEFNNLIKTNSDNFSQIGNDLTLNTQSFEFSFTLDDFARSFGDAYGIDINNYSDLTDLANAQHGANWSVEEYASAYQDNVDIINALQSGSISSFDAGQIAAAANSSLQEVADTIRAATSAGVSVDLEATAQGLGYSSFADAVSAYNEQHGTNYTVDEAKESLGQ